MSSSVSKAYLLSRAAEYKKKIDGGKLTPKKKKVAQTAYYNYLRRAKAKADKNPAQIQKPVAPGQGFLPNFLNQVSVVRIEELIAQIAFKAVSRTLAEKLGVTVEELQQAVAE